MFWKAFWREGFLMGTGWDVMMNLVGETVEKSL